MSDNRFVNVGGVMTRPASTGKFGSPQIGYFDTYQEALNALNQGGSGTSGGVSPRTIDLSGGTSNTSGSPLPQTQPTDTTGTDTSTGFNMDEFNNAMTAMLKQGQGLTTADLLKQKRDLERAAVGKSSEITPENLRTLSPTQQDAIRSGNVNTLSSEIDNNKYQLEKAQQSIDNFFKVHDSLMKISQDAADKMVAPDSVIENARQIIQANPDNMSVILAGFNDKSKQKIIEGLDYSKLGSTTNSKIVKINGVDYQQNPDGSYTAPSVPKVATAAAQDTISVIDDLLSDSHLNAITGIGQNPFNALGLTNQATINKYNQLKGMLALQNRSQLKGSGAISDFEFKVLGEASSALSRNLSNAEFKKELQNLRDKLAGGENGTGSNGGTSGGSNGWF